MLLLLLLLLLSPPAALRFPLFAPALRVGAETGADDVEPLVVLVLVLAVVVAVAVAVLFVVVVVGVLVVDAVDDSVCEVAEGTGMIKESALPSSSSLVSGSLVRGSLPVLWVTRLIIVN